MSSAARRCLTDIRGGVEDPAIPRASNKHCLMMKSLVRAIKPLLLHDFMMTTQIEWRKISRTLEVPEAVTGAFIRSGLYETPISGHRVHSSLIEALALVKKACCQANLETGYLSGKKRKLSWQL